MIRTILLTAAGTVIGIGAYNTWRALVAVFALWAFRTRRRMEARSAARKAAQRR